MKKLIYLFFIALLVNCTSNSKPKTHIIMSANPKLTSQNYLEAMLKTIKHYPIEPYYYLFVSNQACYYEILVNDIPAFKYFKDGQMATPIDINAYVNKSGVQTITYKLYPLTERESGEGFKELLYWTEIEIEIFQRNKADTAESAFASEQKVIKHHSATKTDGKTFIADGQDYYEYTFSFNADVPYHNIGWENSMDLSKMNQEKLLNKTENAYQQVWQNIKDHKVENYFGCLYTKEIEINQSNYSTENDLNETLDAYMGAFINPEYLIQPLEQYKMVLYGNGKVVCLEQNSLDKRFRGKSALWGKFKDKYGNVVGSYRKLYLHIPKGKTDFEIIR